MEEAGVGVGCCLFFCDLPKSDNIIRDVSVPSIISAPLSPSLSLAECVFPMNNKAVSEVNNEEDDDDDDDAASDALSLRYKSIPEKRQNLHSIPPLTQWELELELELEL